MLELPVEQPCVVRGDVPDVVEAREPADHDVLRRYPTARAISSASCWHPVVVLLAEVGDDLLIGLGPPFVGALPPLRVRAADCSPLSGSLPGSVNASVKHVGSSWATTEVRPSTYPDAEEM
jgi:hypothetical protein